jgi:hypothetical protein
MVELREQADARMTRSYGGDTLNTAIYLARLGASVDYVTALGDDVWSDEMLSGWRAEGVGTDLVVRLAGRVPGLYIIRTDENGERRFYYWRDSAPARQLFALPQTEALCELLTSYDLVYFSGITLSLYDDAGTPSDASTLFSPRMKIWGCRRRELRGQNHRGGTRSDRRHRDRPNSGRPETRGRSGCAVCAQSGCNARAARGRGTGDAAIHSRSRNLIGIDGWPSLRFRHIQVFSCRTCGRHSCPESARRAVSPSKVLPDWWH